MKGFRPLKVTVEQETQMNLQGSLEVSCPWNDSLDKGEATCGKKFRVSKTETSGSVRVPPNNQVNCPHCKRGIIIKYAEKGGG